MTAILKIVTFIFIFSLKRRFNNFHFFTNILTFIEKEKLILSTLGNLLISNSQAKLRKKSIRGNLSVKLHL